LVALLAYAWHGWFAVHPFIHSYATNPMHPFRTRDEPQRSARCFSFAAFVTAHSRTVRDLCGIACLASCVRGAQRDPDTLKRTKTPSALRLNPARAGGHQAAIEQSSAEQAIYRPERCGIVKMATPRAQCPKGFTWFSRTRTMVGVPFPSPRRCSPTETRRRRRGGPNAS
jgi:hypothetical protein